LRFATAPVAFELFARALVFGCAALGRRAREVSEAGAEGDPVPPLAETAEADDAAPPPAPFAASRPPPRRLSLRTPGRDLGRLPSTPGASLFSAAMPEK
jgi:hypothetical protein